MTLQEAEFIANEFNKLTSVQSAEVVPNVDGDYSVLITRTDGRRAVSCDLDTADGALRVVKIEGDYAHAVYATLARLRYSSCSGPAKAHKYKTAIKRSSLQTGLRWQGFE
jgi:hypothetical protein